MISLPACLTCQSTISGLLKLKTSLKFSFVSANLIFSLLLSKSSLWLDLQRVKHVYLPRSDEESDCVLKYCAWALSLNFHLPLETSILLHNVKGILDYPSDIKNISNYTII